jgi:hypothetical protein
MNIGQNSALEASRLAAVRYLDTDLLLPASDLVRWVPYLYGHWGTVTVSLTWPQPGSGGRKSIPDVTPQTKCEMIFAGRYWPG